VSIATPPPPATVVAPVGETCPLCGAPLYAEQEWCLRCGAAARTRLAAPPNWKAPVVTLAVVAALSLGVLAAALVKLAGGSSSATTPSTTTVTSPAALAPTTVAPGTTALGGALPRATTHGTTTPGAVTPGATTATPALTATSRALTTPTGAAGAKLPSLKAIERLRKLGLIPEERGRGGK
jgi:hypothetical protein